MRRLHVFVSLHCCTVFPFTSHSVGCLAEATAHSACSARHPTLTKYLTISLGAKGVGTWLYAVLRPGRESAFALLSLEAELETLFVS